MPRTGQRAYRVFDHGKGMKHVRGVKMCVRVSAWEMHLTAAKERVCGSVGGMLKAIPAGVRGCTCANVECVIFVVVIPNEHPDAGNMHAEYSETIKQKRKQQNKTKQNKTQQQAKQNQAKQATHQVNHLAVAPARLRVLRWWLFPATLQARSGRSSAGSGSSGGSS